MSWGGGGGFLPKGVSSLGVSAWGCLPRGDVCPGGVCLGGSARHFPRVNRITVRCKTLPYRNYIAIFHGQVMRNEIKVFSINNLTMFQAVVDLTAEIYNVTARKLAYELPGMFAGLMSAALRADPDSLPPEIVINETDHKAQFYNITVKGLDHVVSAWTAHLVVRRCASNVSTG